PLQCRRRHVGAPRPVESTPTSGEPEALGSAQPRTPAGRGAVDADRPVDEHAADELRLRPTTSAPDARADRWQRSIALVAIFSITVGFAGVRGLGLGDR